MLTVTVKTFFMKLQKSKSKKVSNS